MPVDRWIETTLGEHFRIKHGWAFKGEFFANSGTYVLLTPGNFRRDGGLESRGERERFYVGEFPPEYLLKFGELLMVLTDLTQNAPILGSPAIISEGGKYLHNQRLGKVVEIDESKLAKSFLYHLLNAPFVREQIKATATGSTVRHTAPDRIYAIRVKLPGTATQERIANVLSAYDDLVENNTRRIKILERMAQMLYREWFVNFRFPGHVKVRMVKANVGKVPESWSCLPSTEAIEIDPTTKVSREGLKPFVPMGSLSPDSMLITAIEEREGNAGSKFRNGDTLFARITPCLENGKTGFVQFLPTADAVAFGSTEFIVLRSRTVCPEYVYLMARSDEFRDNAIKSMSGATGRQRVQQGCFEKFSIAQPPAELLRDFQAVASPMFQLIHTLSLKNANLRQTRNMLLHKLLSGEVSVEQLESEATTQNV